MKTYKTKDLRFKWHFLSFLVLLMSVNLAACSDDEGESDTPGTISGPSSLTVTATNLAAELQIQFQNTNYMNVKTIEISYEKTDGTEPGTLSLNGADYTVVFNYLLKLPSVGTYEVGVTLIGYGGERSETVTRTATTFDPGTVGDTPMIDLANEAMQNLIEKYFHKSSRTIWQTWYPNVMSGNGVYWDGDALVWGQGAGLSAFVSMRKATNGLSIGGDYLALENDMFDGIQGFWKFDSRDGVTAYSCYPDAGNDRFFDDNVWIGLDMAKWYEITKDQRYLTQAVAVWEYLTTVGYDETCHGGILWKELPEKSTSKHTCSTAPAGVLSCRLYNITKDEKYLEWAKKLYEWLVTYMQDPSDYLFWDNARPDANNPLEIGSIETPKYAYNSGQPLQLACMLYKITGEDKYLNNAYNIAEACFNKWFITYTSNVFGAEINILKPNEDMWFNAVMSRGFFELYSIDQNPVYLDALKKTMIHAWFGNARRDNGLIDYNDLTGGGTPQTSWEVRHEAAIVEMMAELASWEREKEAE